MLVVAAVAYSATNGKYQGKTSQEESLTFKVAGGAVNGLEYRIRDKCTDGHILRVLNHGFPPIKISHNQFGGTFGPAGEPAVIHGTFSGKKVTGSIKDSSVYIQTGELCKGSTTFTAMRR